MNLRLTAALSVFAALLALLIVFWDRDGDTARERLEQARRAFRFNPERVDRLMIDSSGVSIECQLKGDQWYLVHPIASRADPVAIERLLGALQELPRGNIILPPRRDPEAYTPYGLDDPRTRISIVEGTATNQILIGRRTPLGDGVYVRQSDHAGLARLQLSLLELIPNSADALRDRSLLSGDAAAIERLDIRSPAGYIQLARNGGGNWRMFQPFTARADTAGVSALIEGLLTCSVSQFVQDGVSDLAPYGLNSQSAVTAVLNTDSGDGSQMLSFGDPLPNAPALVYARMQAENSIYAVPAAVREALLVRPDSLRDRRIPGTEPESIQRVRIEEGESLLEFSRDDEDQWQLESPLRARADSGAIESLLQSWTKVRLTDFESSASTSPPPPFTRTIQIETRDPKRAPVVLHLGRCSENDEAARIQIDGDSAAAMALPSDLLDFSLDPLRYHSRNLALIPPEDIASIQITTPAQTVQLDRNAETGEWTPSVPWLTDLLNTLTPLRADSILSRDAAEAFPDSEWRNPALTLTVQRRGQSGLAFTLVVGAKETDGGTRPAKIRGRDVIFMLSPITLEALTPPPPEETP